MDAEELLAARDRARMSLIAWREVAESRAVRVRLAVAAGIPKAEIARLLNVSRMTVYADLKGS